MERNTTAIAARQSMAAGIYSVPVTLKPPAVLLALRLAVDAHRKAKVGK